MMKEFTRLEKGARLCMYLSTGTMTITALAALSGAVFATGLWADYLPVRIGYVLFLAASLANAFISPAFRYERYRYRINEEAIDVTEGYLWVSEYIVPIERIQNLEILQGPFDRGCKVAKVKVTTGGGVVTLRFLAKDKAEAIADSLKAKINSAAIKQKAELEGAVFEDGKK